MTLALSAPTIEQKDVELTVILRSSEDQDRTYRVNIDALEVTIRDGDSNQYVRLSHADLLVVADLVREQQKIAGV